MHHLSNSGAFLMLYGIALATEGWGVVASLNIYPPFAGAAVSAVTLVVSFGFAVSRPCLTLKVCILIISNIQWVDLTWCQSATIFAYSGFNILWKELLCIFIPSNVYWVQLITFSYISRWWMMQFIFSARIPLFKQLHDLPLRCVWFWI